MKARQSSKLIRLLILPVLLVLLWSPLATRAQHATAPKRVLVLYWYDKGFPGHVVWDQSFQATLNSVADPVDYYPEYLEANRFPGENQSQILHDYLLKKYADLKIDVVVAQSDTSLNFLLKYRDDLFPNAPIVFYSGSRPLGVLENRNDLTGVIVISSYKRTLDLALTLHPQVNQVFVISGTLEHDKSFEIMARKELEGIDSRVQINYLTDLSPEELTAKTATLPEGSLVLYAWQQARDNQGKVLESGEILKSISRTSPVPIYAMSGPLVGQGIVGGYTYTVEAGAAKVAEIVRRIARGERAQDIAVENVPTVPMFDWRELRRWRISEDSLPAGSVIRFKELTFWQAYKWYIVGLVSACVIEGLLIAGLLVMRVRRRQAERENERLARAAAAEHRQLNEVVSNVPGIVWQSSVEPGTNERKTTFISNYVEKMLGYTAAEWLSAPSGFGLTLMPDAEDRQQSLRASETVIRSGKEGFVRFRWITKDGRTLWVESYLTPIFDDDGKVVGLRGVSLDVSERILAEESQRRSEQRSRAIVRAIPDQIFLLTPDGTYLDYQVTDVKGPYLPLEKFIGRNIREVLPPNVAENLFERIQRARENSEPQILEYQIQIGKADRWFEARIVSMGDNILYVMRDISERKEAEEALRISNEELSHLKNQLEEENIYLREEISLEQNFGEMVGESAELRYVLFKIAEVGPTESTVLITGETGTGKELVARAIHNASNRRDRPLVKVNCAALSPSLIESEFFGHEKGAFTGATARKIGRFELANGATIFLDEIGELPIELQVKLLRVIQEGEFERLGSSDTIKVDVRIIAATNRNLDQEVKRGAFREDLWYRLNVFPVTVPPLRQRRDDIPLLVQHFAGRFAKKLGRTITGISPATAKSLRDYSWPGNVRELANVIERAVISSRGSTLRIGEEFTEAGTENLLQASKTLKEFEREYILHVLHETGWRIEGRRGTARILGLNPSTLRARIVKLGIQKPTQS